MACRTEVINSLSYSYCPDDLPLRADRIQAIMVGRFVDELTGNPIKAQLTVRTELQDVWFRSTSDAVAGLIANPLRRFPGLATNNVALGMTVSCRGFMSQTFQRVLGPFNIGVGSPADFPHHFSAVNLGDVGLHRRATVIHGRCVLNSGATRIPLNNAEISLSGIYHQFPAADVDPLTVVEASNIISLLHGLYAERDIAASQVRRRLLQPQLGDEKKLLLPAMAGEDQLRLSNRINISVGDIVGIEIEHSERVEYMEITGLAGAASASQPATATLAYPLRAGHRKDIQVVRVNPQPAGAANTLSRDAISGDQTLFLNALTDIDNTTLEISGTGATEYHSVSLYNVNTDGDGYFRLPPVSRIAMLHLHASHSIPAPDIDRIFSPDYEQLHNSVDLIFG